MLVDYLSQSHALLLELLRERIKTAFELRLLNIVFDLPFDKLADLADLDLLLPHSLFHVEKGLVLEKLLLF